MHCTHVILGDSGASKSYCHCICYCLYAQVQLLQYKYIFLLAIQIFSAASFGMDKFTGELVRHGNFKEPVGIMHCMILHAYMKSANQPACKSSDQYLLSIKVKGSSVRRKL